MSLLCCKQHAERNCVICYPSPRDSMVIELLDKVMVIQAELESLKLVLEKLRANEKLPQGLRGEVDEALRILI